MASLLHPPSFDTTLGAVLIGFSVSCVAFGAILVQTFHYFTRFPSDRLAYKIIVITLLVLELLDQIFIGHTLYFYAITNFANVLVILRASMTWSFIMQQLLGSICGTVVRVCFALRVWRFSKHNWLITTSLMLLNSGVLGAAIAFSVKSFSLPSVFAVAGLRVLGTVALGLGVVTDVLTAAALCYFLNRFRTGHARSDTLVNGLLIYAINTGAVTSLVSTATLTLYNVMPGNLIFVAAYFLLSKVYAISFLAALNTRKVVRGRGTTDRNTSIIPFQVTSRMHVSEPTLIDAQISSHPAEFIKRGINMSDDFLRSREVIPMHNISHHREYDLPGMAV
ncbi:uncharacterized protein BT62DRAFT_937351 [Guyanagaster necrorhizus]|uniref:DUF6534 domain-containing protein n=1 Tax=Guyanagaster necrorhizus TaxID=856835 RepID=A0A9P8AMT8_9AGAR|nr:uncharacterized protein BT62DRAFT_937351 [Guyanagaster necrorhizus MCA 3950]KAG7441109.1 hypothetical protein BT62DRAFT_937351 [Guyanagaster necrorhizus MCA 3950]